MSARPTPRSAEPHERPGSACTGSKGRTIPLKVLPGDRLTVRKSKASRWRAGALIGIHLAIAAHLVQWWWSGRDDGVRSTLSPIEPSEAMYTLNEGVLNAGAVFFGAALLSTLVFGRWFCGWACHIVALQDLCTWLLKKVRITPKPFRSRLLMLVPLAMALYMFAWPSVHRWVLTPWLGEKLPYWLGRSMPWPGLENGLVVEDFWATMPPWWLAIPFLFVCGFVAVYVLGNKGFCTYGCPYGAFFAPIERFAPMRIVVSDACEGCGHCTAVCSSNVRVHEEVRDFGMVVDPGCMKCLDCVSVCPNGALSFGIAKPSALKGNPRTPTPNTNTNTTPPLRTSHPRSDLSWAQEVVLLVIFLAALFGSIRGMGIPGTGERVPLLFAAGLASIVTFAVWKTWSLLREPNVRLQNLQLKLKGRIKPLGWMTAGATMLMVGICVWGGLIGWTIWGATLGYVKLVGVASQKSVVFAPGFVASPEVKLLAAPVIRRLEFASPWSRGGKGWDLRVEEELQLSWAYAASGELGKAQDAATRALRLQRPQSVTVAADLGQIIRLRQFTPEQTWAAFDDAMKGNDQAGGVMLARAYAHLLNQQPKEAAEWITRSLYAGAATDAVTQLQAVQLRLVLSQIGAESPGEALKMADAGLAARPDSVELRHARALATSAMGNMDDAITQALAIVQDEPRYRPVMDLLVMWYEQRGQPEEAARWFERSKALVTGATH